jgi:ribosomal protein S8
MLTRIRNATLAKKSNVNIPFTKLNQEIAQFRKRRFYPNFQISMETNDIVLRLKYTSKKNIKEKQKNQLQI